MARIAGVDSLSRVTEGLVATAKKALGTTPAFWGRYFTRVSATEGEFRHATEGPILAKNQIRVLPLARQTNRVGGTEDDGRADGKDNAADLVATFGAAALAVGGVGARIFLDVEGTKPSLLTRDYYTGWAQGLAQGAPGILISPCVYGNLEDAQTWRELAAAVHAGAPCGGIWLCHTVAPVKEPREAWDPIVPTSLAGVDVVLWQYMFDRHNFIDRDLLNPNLPDPDGFLSSLVLPAADANFV